MFNSNTSFPQKEHLTIIHSTDTLRIVPIIVILNTHRRTHNQPFLLQFCQSNLFQRIQFLFNHVFHAKVLSESNAIYPTSTSMERLSPNAEEIQLLNLQLFLYQEL